ncbi:MAG: YraN family protein [bacterium]|nr:YraN family protein [bacterium]
MWKLISGDNAAPEVRDRGRAGEAHAMKYLEAKGLRILARNWSCSMGELDIVAKQGENIVFVEVKSAGRQSGFRPEDRVNREKQKRIRRLARAYLKSERLDAPVRYDIVTVIWHEGETKVEHLINAFI